MAAAIEAAITNHRRAQAKAKAKNTETAAISQTLACPYCNDHAFDRDENLWSHVQTDHSQQLNHGNGNSTRAASKKYRQIVREAALLKATSLTAPGRGVGLPRKAGPPILSDADIEPSLGMHRLNLDDDGDSSPVKIELDSRPKAPRQQQLRAAGKADRLPHRPAPSTRAHRPSGQPSSDSYGRRKPVTGKLFDHTATRGPTTSSASVGPVSSGALSAASPQAASRRTSRSPEIFSASPPPSPAVEALPQSKATRERGILEIKVHDRYPECFLQPESRPISQSQLAAEVKSIYAGLVMVENKCISVDKAQAAAIHNVEKGQLVSLEDDHWQALIALHRTLLHEHHDFFLASQHPSATPALKRLANKYSMPARMWKHAVHSFLELLRKRLPESLEYMLSFTYLSYQMVALLYETVPAFEDTWIECLGDLGRYRMAIEDEDLRDRETWAAVARFWYSKAADKNAAIGRLYHHLAILARPHALQQLYFYSRSLACVQPFMSTRESILTLLEPILGRTRSSYIHASEVDVLFIKSHALLFLKDDIPGLQSLISDFLRQLDGHIGRVTAKWKDQGVYMAVTNITSLFDYGAETSVLRKMFDAHFRREIQSICQPRVAPGETAVAIVVDTPPPNQEPQHPSWNPQAFLSHPTTKFALQITFHTFGLALQRIGDKNVLPHVHILLLFLVNLSSTPNEGSAIFEHVPWNILVDFLNTLAKAEAFELAKVDSTRFPQENDNDRRPLPEDYLIQGQIWSLRYFPSDWFGQAIDEDERHLELASTARTRVERILYLGSQLVFNIPWLRLDTATNSWCVDSASLTTSIGDDTTARVIDSDASASSTVSSGGPIDTVVIEASPDQEEHFPDPILESVEKLSYSTSASAMSRRVIHKGYTAIVCDTDMLLNQTDVFVLLLENQDWRVQVPLIVVRELCTYASEREPSARRLQAQQALGSIEKAFEQQKCLTIIDRQGKPVSDPKTVVFDSKDHGVEETKLAGSEGSPDDMACIIIEITRRASDLTLEEQDAGNLSTGAKPAILVAESRETRLKARKEGLTSVAGSMIRRLLSTQRKGSG